VKLTVLDYAESAIEQAKDRTRDKRDRLSFVTGDMNALDLREQSFDTVISIVTLYWVEDLTNTMTQIAKLLKPGGQMGIFMLKHIPDGRKATEYSAEETPLGKSLSEIGLSFNAHDYTIQNDAFWHRIYQAAKDLQDEFEAECNGFITASLIRESEEDFLPFIEKGTLARYLYHVRT
jgi:ubiquinone/menaquinone biosynthesis C-methylase UbiE